MASTYRFPGGGKTARVGAQLWGVGGGDELVLRLHTEQSVSNPNTIDSKRISTYHDESTAKKRVKNKLISNNGGSPKWKDKTKKFDAAATGQSLGTPISHVEHFISLSGISSSRCFGVQARHGQGQQSPQFPPSPSLYYTQTCSLELRSHGHLPCPSSTPPPDPPSSPAPAAPLPSVPAFTKPPLHLILQQHHHTLPLL